MIAMLLNILIKGVDIMYGRISDEKEKILMKEFAKSCERAGVENILAKYQEHKIPNTISELIVGHRLSWYILQSRIGNNLPRRLDCYDRYCDFEFRDIAIHYCGFSLVAWEWVDPLIKQMKTYTNNEQPKILEIMAGMGAITFALRQKGLTDVIACDNQSIGEIFDYSKQWTNVEFIDCIEAMKQHPETQIVICSWPRDDGTMTKFIKTMHEVNPKCVLIYIGELEYGCNAEVEFFDNVIETHDFYEAEDKFKSWSGINDGIHSFKYKVDEGD